MRAFLEGVAIGCGFMVILGIALWAFGTSSPVQIGGIAFVAVGLIAGGFSVFALREVTKDR